MVFPAFGGATINPRVPNPIGQKRSINLHAGGHPGYSNVNLGAGSSAVSSENGFRCEKDSGVIPSISTNRSTIWRTCRPRRVFVSTSTTSATTLMHGRSANVFANDDGTTGSLGLSTKPSLNCLIRPSGPEAHSRIPRTVLMCVSTETKCPAGRYVE